MIEESKLEEHESVKKQEDVQGAKRLEEACKIYYKLVESRMKQFQEIKLYLSQVLEQLLEENKIGNDIILLSRIKSPVSVVENWRLGKNLHDIFGITLLTQNEDEMERIMEEINAQNRYNVHSAKKMNACRGYKATHFLFNIEDENKNNTNVECHMQTYEQYKDVYPHIFYKVKRNFKRDLTEDEERQIQQQIQDMFESGVLPGRKIAENKKIRLPQMWVACFEDNGKMEEIELDEIQRMLIMYPFLDLSKKMDPEEQNNQGER